MRPVSHFMAGNALMRIVAPKNAKQCKWKVLKRIASKMTQLKLTIKGPTERSLIVTLNISASMGSGLAENFKREILLAQNNIENPSTAKKDPIGNIGCMNNIMSKDRISAE